MLADMIVIDLSLVGSCTILPSSHKLLFGAIFAQVGVLSKSVAWWHWWLLGGSHGSCLVPSSWVAAAILSVARVVIHP